MEKLIAKVVNLPPVAHSVVFDHIPLLQLLLLESSKNGLWGLSLCIADYLNPRRLASKVFQCSNIEHIMYLLITDKRREYKFMNKLRHLDLAASSIRKSLFFFGKNNKIVSVNLSWCGNLSTEMVKEFLSMQIGTLQYISLGFRSLMDPDVSFSNLIFYRNFVRCKTKVLFLIITIRHGISWKPAFLRY